MKKILVLVLSCFLFVSCDTMFFALRDAVGGIGTNITEQADDEDTPPIVEEVKFEYVTKYLGYCSKNENNKHYIEFKYAIVANKNFTIVYSWDGDFITDSFAYDEKSYTKYVTFRKLYNGPITKGTVENMKPNFLIKEAK